MSKTHTLKTWPNPFEAVASGRKTHEWRRDDRPFEVGDELLLDEFLPCITCQASGRLPSQAPCCGAPHGLYTGRRTAVYVTYITRPPEFGVPDGWLVMSISATKPGVTRNPRVYPLPGDVVEDGDDVKRALVLALLDEPDDCDPVIGPPPHVEARIDSKSGQRQRVVMSLESWRKTFGVTPP